MLRQGALRLCRGDPFFRGSVAEGDSTRPLQGRRPLSCRVDELDDDDGRPVRSEDEQPDRRKAMQVNDMLLYL